MRCFSLKESTAAVLPHGKDDTTIKHLKTTAEVRSHCFEVCFLVCQFIMQHLLLSKLVPFSSNTPFTVPLLAGNNIHPVMGGVGNECKGTLVIRPFYFFSNSLQT